MNDYADEYGDEYAGPYESQGDEVEYDRSIEQETNAWAVALHLVQYFPPPFGLICVILIWMLKKEELPGIDAHGRVVTNWLISQFIYLVVGVILCIVVIGVPILILFGVLGWIFPVIGAVNASVGKVWRYPLSIQFV